jgi:hypothetical protein
MKPATREGDSAAEPCGRYEWERIVRRAVIPKAVKYVAFVLATYADPDGTRVRPGMDVLAAVTGEGVSTVRRRVSKLRGTYGLLEMVSRGGGRNGRGKAAEFRLVLPTDLLERVELLPPGDNARRGSIRAVSNVSPLPQVSGQSEDSPLPQGSAQSGPSPVDNSESPLTVESAQSVEDEPIDRSLETTSDGLTAQNRRLTAHPGERLPPTTPTTTDQPGGPDPTQPTTAREQSDIQPISLVGVVKLKPAKCPHGLPAHIRNGQPSCPLCRRSSPPKESA